MTSSPVLAILKLQDEKVRISVQKRLMSKISSYVAFLAMVQQRRGPKMRPHRVQQPGHTLPRLPEVYRILITDTSVYSGCAAVVFSTVLA